MLRGLTSLAERIASTLVASFALLCGLFVLTVPQLCAQQVMVTVSKGNLTDPFSGPQNVVFNQAGNLFVSDTGNHRVQRVDTQSGVVSTVAGTGALGNTGDGGPGISAQLNCPSGLAFGRHGHLLIADACAQVVRIVAPSATDGLIQGRSDERITLFAGGGSSTAGPGVGPTALNLTGP